MSLLLTLLARLIILDDECQCCRLFMFVYSRSFKTLPVSLNMVNKESESESEPKLQDNTSD